MGDVCFIWMEEGGVMHRCCISVYTTMHRYTVGTVRTCYCTEGVRTGIDV
jgi:hypothetical protein